MRRRAGRPRRGYPLLACVALVAGAACGKSNGGSPAPDADPESFILPAESCAYTCPIAGCAEVTTPYACQNLAAWGQVPHAPECPAWDGKTPEPQKGQCTASAPSGDAAKYAGPDGAAYVLPDGRRVRPAGAEWVFNEADMTGGLTSAAARVPGTNFVLTVDTGPGEHSVRVVDATRIGTLVTPVVSYVKFARPSTLNSGITVVPPDLAYVSTNDGVVQALHVDAAGTLTKDDARTIKLPGSLDGNGKPVNWYTSGVAASPDKKLLVVTPVAEKTLLVFDIAAGSPTYGQKLGETTLPASESFGAWFDPADAGHVYVSMWSGRAVVEVDVSKPQAPALGRKFATDKDPEQIAFLDARWMAVTNDLGDTLSIVDRSSGAVRSVPIEANALHGLEPTALAWDKTHSRLFVALSGMNAVAAYDVDLAKDPPQVTPAGRLGTSWWPSGIALMDDGALVVTSLRAHGSGPRPVHFAVGDGDIGDRMRGSVQAIPASVALAPGDTSAVDANDDVGALAGHPTVSCPPGVDDFPVPQTNTAGPSKRIDHVIFIVRENKDFDGLFGDLPGVEGHADLVLKPGAGDMEAIWQNLRALVRAFAMSDNYYTDAVYSTQGHNWTTYGRASDFDERTWAISGDGRNARSIPGGGVIDVGQPEEGSLFDWLGNNGIPYDVLGEIVGSPRKSNPDHPPLDVKYPGGPFQNILFNDLPKACHVAGRLRVRCDLGNFVYMTLPNDHTGGLSPSSPLPETYCAVNDEATGMIIDAITHSPTWPSTLVLITEDDPSQGGEHIDSHRAPFVLVSPWIKRGYVSKTHIDVASAHKLFAHIFGKPYPNQSVAKAGLPLDMFTSTPDYTPYTYKPRTWPLACGDKATGAEKSLTGSWDFSEPDDQPGLDAQVTRWMRGTQLEVLPPKTRAAAEARILSRAPREP